MSVNLPTEIDLLRESGEALRTIIEAVPQLVWRANPDGTADFATRRFQKFVGRELDELLGWKWLELIHSEDQARVGAEWARCRQARSPISVDFRLVVKDGERWVRSEGNPYFDAQGNLIKYYGTWTDMTERVLAERARESSVSQFQSLANAVPQIVWTAKGDGSIDYGNSKWYAYTGFTEAETFGFGFAKAVHPEDVEHTMSVYAQAIATKTPFQLQHRFRDRDGNYRWFLVRGVPCLGDLGEIQKWFGTCTDVDEQKQASRELEHFWSLPDHLLAIADAESGYLQELSPAWETILGHSLEELKSRPWIDFVHPEDCVATEAVGRGFKRGEGVQNFQNRYRTKAGDWRWLSWTTHPIDGRLYCTVRDITDMKAGEEALRAAKVAADRANLSKSNFLANMSHELRTPMTAVLGFAEVLRDRSLSEEERMDALDRIERSGRSLLRLIDDVLDISKVEAGKLTTEKIRFSPLELVTEVVSFLRLQADQKVSTCGPSLLKMCLTLPGPIPHAFGRF